MTEIDPEALPMLISSAYTAFFCLGCMIWLNIELENKYAQLFEV